MSSRIPQQMHCRQNQCNSARGLLDHPPVLTEAGTMFGAATLPQISVQQRRGHYALLREHLDGHAVRLVIAIDNQLTESLTLGQESLHRLWEEIVDNGQISLAVP